MTRDLPRNHSSSQSKPLLELKDLAFWYGKNSQKSVLFHHVNLSLNQGELVTIRGLSGSGKSTLLHLIYGFLKPKQGKILVNGRSLAWLPDIWLSRLRARSFGYVFQDFRLIPHYTVYENLALPLYFSGQLRPGSKKQIQRIADELGIADKLSHYPITLSGGEKQRAAIARAIVHQPRLLVADEPTGNLDKVNSRIIRDLMRKLQKTFNLGIIIVTHDPVLARLGRQNYEIRDQELKQI